LTQWSIGAFRQVHIFAWQQLWFLHQLKIQAPTAVVLPLNTTAGVALMAALGIGINEIAGDTKRGRAFQVVRPVQDCSGSGGVAAIGRSEGCLKQAREAEEVLDDQASSSSTSTSTTLRLPLLRLSTQRHVLLLQQYIHYLILGRQGCCLSRWRCFASPLLTGKATHRWNSQSIYADFAVWQ